MPADFKSSKTKENLMRAFAGESQARNRYTFAAGQCRQQQLYVVADLFNFTANQEKEHAEVFYNHLTECSGETIHINGGYPVDISKKCEDLLKMAHHNEYEEYEDVYPSFAAVAREEGFSKIAQDFENISKVEKCHGDRFNTFKTLMESGRLFEAEEKTTWVCLNCGYILESAQAPKNCPVCLHPQGYFLRMNMAPWGCKQ